MKEVVYWNHGENVADDNHFVNKVFSSIKNLMSDLYVTQTKFNKIFTEFLCSVLPDIVSNWQLLSKQQQQNENY